MPTNREWLEHTERAAWDTVQSLRRQIEEERVRVARLTPVRESWQRILEVLDRAKTEHALGGERYTDIVEALTAELRKAKEERERLLGHLEQTRKAHAEQESRVEVLVVESEDRPKRGGTVRWFAGKIAALRREQAERQRARPTLDRLILALEAKVEELDGAGSTEITRIAVELGSLALRAAELAGGTKRRVPRDDEEE